MLCCVCEREREIILKTGSWVHGSCGRLKIQAGKQAGETWGRIDVTDRVQRSDTVWLAWLSSLWDLEKSWVYHHFHIAKFLKACVFGFSFVLIVSVLLFVERIVVQCSDFCKFYELDNREFPWRFCGDCTSNAGVAELGLSSKPDPTAAGSKRKRKFFGQLLTRFIKNNINALKRMEKVLLSY